MAAEVRPEELDPIEEALCPHCGVSLHAESGESYVHVTQTWVATLEQRFYKVDVVIVDESSMDTTCTCATCDGIILPDDMEWS